MSIKHFCDKCEEETDGEDLSKLENIDYYDFFLCPTCLQALKDWISNE